MLRRLDRAMNTKELAERVEANTELAEALRVRFNELIDHLKTKLGDNPDVVLDFLKVTEGEL